MKFADSLGACSACELRISSLGQVLGKWSASTRSPQGRSLEKLKNTPPQMSNAILTLSRSPLGVGEGAPLTEADLACGDRLPLKTPQIDVAMPDAGSDRASVKQLAIRGSLWTI